MTKDAGGRDRGVWMEEGKIKDQWRTGGRVEAEEQVDG